MLIFFILECLYYGKSKKGTVEDKIVAIAKVLIDETNGTKDFIFKKYTSPLFYNLQEVEMVISYTVMGIFIFNIIKIKPLCDLGEWILYQAIYDISNHIKEYILKILTHIKLQYQENEEIVSIYFKKYRTLTFMDKLEKLYKSQDSRLGQHIILLMFVYQVINTYKYHKVINLSFLKSGRAFCKTYPGSLYIIDILQMYYIILTFAIITKDTSVGVAITTNIITKTFKIMSFLLLCKSPILKRFSIQIIIMLIRSYIYYIKAHDKDPYMYAQNIISLHYTVKKIPFIYHSQQLNFEVNELIYNLEYESYRYNRRT